MLLAFLFIKLPNLLKHNHFFSPYKTMFLFIFVLRVLIGKQFCFFFYMSISIWLPNQYFHVKLQTDLNVKSNLSTD